MADLYVPQPWEPGGYGVVEGWTDADYMARNAASQGSTYSGAPNYDYSQTLNPNYNPAGASDLDIGLRNVAQYNLNAPPSNPDFVAPENVPGFDLAQYHAAKSVNPFVGKEAGITNPALYAQSMAAMRDRPVASGGDGSGRLSRGLTGGVYPQAPATGGVLPQAPGTQGGKIGSTGGYPVQQPTAGGKMGSTGGYPVQQQVNPQMAILAMLSRALLGR